MTLTEINRILKSQLPGADLTLQVLPDCNGLSLFLLNPDFDDRHLSSDVQDAISDEPPYWIFCWASGRALAQYILAGQLDVTNKRVVDFGAGSGVVAIAAKLAGAASVVACEIDPIAHQLIALNAQANGVTIEHCERLEQLGGPVDLILAADVLYERENLRWLDLFPHYAEKVVIADSRQKNLLHACYGKTCRITTSSFPDFAEALTFNEVTVYSSN